MEKKSGQTFWPTQYFLVCISEGPLGRKIHGRIYLLSHDPQCSEGDGEELLSLQGSETSRQSRYLEVQRGHSLVGLVHHFLSKMRS